MLIGLVALVLALAGSRCGPDTAANVPTAASPTPAPSPYVAEPAAATSPTATTVSASPSPTTTNGAELTPWAQSDTPATAAPKRTTVPDITATATSEATASPTKELARRPSPARQQEVYTVRSGDSLWSISRKYGLTVEELARANGLSRDGQLNAGQRLRIPSPGAETAQSLPEPRRNLEAPRERPLAQLAPGLVRYLQGRQGDSAAAVYDPVSDTLYTWNGNARFGMASTVKLPIMITQLAQQYEQDAGASQPGTELLVPMITVSDNDAATALLAEVGGPRAVEMELRERGVSDTEINPEAWGLSTTTAPDMALLMRSLYYGEGLNPRLRDVAFGLLSGVVDEQRWGVPAGLPASSRVAFKGGWLPVDEGWLVHQVGVAEVNGRPLAFAFYNSGQPSFEYGQATLQGAARRLAQQSGR